MGTSVSPWREAWEAERDRALVHSLAAWAVASGAAKGALAAAEDQARDQHAAAVAAAKAENKRRLDEYTAISKAHSEYQTAAEHRRSVMKLNAGQHAVAEREAMAAWERGRGLHSSTFHLNLSRF
jgi:hypothetical protein